ncbi:DUF397 domain-containing protein [Actinomadura sp. NAK00032]|uniref:DUF397 domain-containing protein n=1 Tax=Actinomadura sp. NAK00032 TaxID=2742128 RepID=UPI00158FF6AB|nr:DUF397 domain-containing protein [Actinomadura sp. NAK00032]QKW34221.1 DUF397 domain-containing protein [Actinomadura sp. NAK00032]
MDEQMTVWRKARQSNDQGGSCVELAALTGGVGLRDSKDPEGPKLLLPPAAFRTLLTDLKQR